MNNLLITQYILRLSVGLKISCLNSMVSSTSVVWPNPSCKEL